MMTRGMIVKKSSQQGVALITILVMVALATIVASTIAQRQLAMRENTAYLIRQNQSIEYAKSAEAFFSEMLVQDAKDSPETDHLAEMWAKPMPAFPVEDGYVQGNLEDLSGKFNLNSLVKKDGTPNMDAKQLFEGLLQKVGLNAQLSESVIDWIDSDSETIGPMGAEDNYYQGVAPGLKAANQLMFSAEELKQVRGFEGEAYLKIAPYITALNNNESKININTAPAMVLAAISEGLDEQAVNEVMQQRMARMEYFNNVSDLWTIAPFNQIDAAKKQAYASLFDVKSQYFNAKIEVMLSGRKRQFSSILLRKKEQVYILSRNLARF